MSKMRLIAVSGIKDEKLLIDRWLQRTAEFADGIVVVDDGSSDGTHETLMKHKSVLKVHRNQPGSARNQLKDLKTALRMAQSFDPDWILFLDGDEIMDARLATELDYLTTQPGAGRYIFQEITLWRSNEMYRTDRPETYSRIRYEGPLLIRNTPYLRWAYDGSFRYRASLLLSRLWAPAIQHGHRKLVGIQGEDVELREIVNLNYHFVDWEKAWKNHMRSAIWIALRKGKFAEPEEVVRLASERLDETGLTLAPVKAEWGVL